MKTEHEPTDPARWLDADAAQTDAAPTGFASLVSTDAARAPDPEQLERIASGLAATLKQPGLVELVRAEQSKAAARTAGQSAGSAAGGTAKLAIAALALGALGLAVYQVLPAATESGATATPAGSATQAPAQPPPARQTQSATGPGAQPQPGPGPMRAAAPTEQSAPPAPTDRPTPRATRSPDPSRVQAVRPAPGRAAPKVARRAGHPHAPAHATPDASGELSLLSRAQKALQTQPARALALAGEHARSFEHGTFAQEREMIAIEALIALGRDARAHARGKHFLTTYPGSSHAPRLHELLNRGHQP